jgi:hypothetical protein
MYIKRGVNSGLFANVHVGKIIRLSPRNIGGAVNARVHAGKTMKFARDDLAYFESDVFMGLTRYAMFTLNITIPPGGVVIIDSDTFTAIMGNQNILHLYKGDWLYFTRNTAQIRLESTSGGSIDGEVIYSERYL